MNIKLTSVFFIAAFASFSTGCSNPEKEKAEADLAAGEAIVKANCLVCHAQGINGAPIIGNAKMWGPRVTKGKDVLLENATNGFGLMPAKGGKTELTEDDLSLAINYMISQIDAK